MSDETGRDLASGKTVEGQFYYDSSSSTTDNGGTVIAPNAGAGRWKRILSWVSNVRSFGAKGDGTTNDTSAIQACINVGGEIVFDAGNYTHGPLTIANPCKIRHLPGASVTPILDVGSLEKLYTITAANVSIDGLTVSNISGTISENKYLIYAGVGADYFVARNANFPPSMLRTEMPG